MLWAFSGGRKLLLIFNDVGGMMSTGIPQISVV